VNLTDAILFDVDARGADFRRAELVRARVAGARLRASTWQHANLETVMGLSEEQLAGTDLTDAKLPEAIARFPGLDAAIEASKAAQRLFVSMLIACAYVLFTVLTTRDSQLVTDTSSSPLPVIGSTVPIVAFFEWTPMILVSLYIYFHFASHELWQSLAELPAIFPDGKSLPMKSHAWLYSDFVCTHIAYLKSSRTFVYVWQKLIFIVLAWATVPAMLVLIWLTYLRRHQWPITWVQVLCLVFAVVAGTVLYRDAVAVLRGLERGRFPWERFWADRRFYLVSLLALGLVAGAYLLSSRSIQGDSPWKVADLHGSRLPDADLRRVDLQGADLIRANLRGTDFQDANLRRVRLYAADLSGAILVAADLSHALLRGAVLTDATLTDANLRGADLRWAKLAHVDFSRVEGSHLEGTDFRGADLTKAKLNNARAIDANFAHAEPNVRPSGDDLHPYALDSRRTTLTQAQLRAADLSRALFQDAILTGADLTESNTPSGPAHFENADLTGAHLDRANLPGAIFTGAKLTRATLTGAILPHADLSGLILTDAKFDGAHLNGASLSDAILVTAVLADADIADAHLERAVIEPEQVTTARNWPLAFYDDDLRKKLGLPKNYREHAAKRDFIEFPLAQKQLAYTDLSGYKLKRANLRQATLKYANLAHTDLTGADLTKADLTGANLTGVNLTGANLTDANLTDANLTDAKGLDSAQLSNAIGAGAAWPDSFDLSRHSEVLLK
jgi:uncharacterized protein YjbI with pentapeptide repeats